MGSDTESDSYPVPKLPLFSMTPHLPEPSGMSTPPLQTAASVPFRWEEQPGKPRPCTDLIVISTNHTTRPDKCLDLPPRLATVESNINITKTSSPSPTTVLDGPGDIRSKSLFKFSSSSFRFETERRRRQGSFDSNCSGGWSPNDVDNGGGQQLLLPGNKNDHRNGGGGGGGGVFGSFRLRKPKGSFVISRSSSSSRNTGLSKVTRSHFLSKIYEGFKQVVPWRKKPKMENLPTPMILY